MKIENHVVKEKVFVVAEVGNNHEGSYSLAEELIGLAHKSKADAVKFQTFIPELFVSSADPARMERMKKFQLSFNQFESLSKLAKKLGIIFFSTPLDLESAAFLNSIQSVFKIASADNTFYSLLKLVSSFKKPIILSTGLGDIDLIKKIRSYVLDQLGNLNEEEHLALLHCISAYPVPLNQVHLGALKTLSDNFPNNIIGYSDHTLGIDTCCYAVAAGAQIIEKHFTIDNNYSDFRDHQLSANPNDFKTMVEKIREIETIRGEQIKISQSSEEALRPALRRSIAAKINIPKDSIISEEMLTWLRPGTGYLCGEENKVIGKSAKNEIKQGTLIEEKDLI